MKIPYYLLLLLVFCSCVVAAQETNFSSYAMAPLELNPALTGAIQKSNWRLNLKHRRQWETFLSDGGGYETYMASIDRRSCLPKKDYWGIGLNLLHDRAGFSPLSKTSAMLSGAFHKILSSRRDRDIYLSLGMELGWIDYRLAPGDYRFDDQFDNPATPDEISGHYGTGMPTGGIGLYFVSAGTSRSSNAFRAGLSVRNLNRPRFQFFEPGLVGETHLNWYVKGHVAWVKELGSSRFSMEPSLLVKYQKPYWQCLTSLNFLLDFKGDNFILHAGPALRWVNHVSSPVSLEALVTNLQVDLNQSSLVFSFDANLSSLSKVSKSIGGFELSYMLRFGGEDCKLVICP